MKKKKQKNPETSVEYTIKKQWKSIVSFAKKYAANKLSSVKKNLNKTD